jgi:hypothetical protein
LQNFKALAVIILSEAIQLGAVASISYGAWLAYAPAGFIVGGCLVLAGSIFPVAGKR